MIEIDIKKELDKMSLEVNLKIKSGSFIAISGKSGSGKTTLLRVLSGLEKASGIIKVDGEVWLDENNFRKPQEREIGFVFQNYALFENMSIEENLLFVKKDRDLANELLKLSELSEFKERLPRTLSGGQKQRVAICRAMMRRPKILLLDEPLSALDSLMRAKLQSEILLLHKKFGTTSLLVSHDVSEIYKLSNRVIILEEGKVIKDGEPKEILLKTSGSQKFSFEGELLEIVKLDVIYMAIIAIGQQLVEVVVSENEAKNLKIGDIVRVGTKAFAPMVSRG
jgi:molybdate transport system ATP-binding protein